VLGIGSGGSADTQPFEAGYQESGVSGVPGGSQDQVGSDYATGGSTPGSSDPTTQGLGATPTPSGLTTILQRMGLLDKNGDINPLMAMSLLGPAAGGLISALSTKKATDQVQQGITNAQNAVAKTLGGPSPFTAYTNMGNAAAGAALGLTFKPTTFAPLGSSSLAALYGKK
jgi:hypothetical protein